MYTPAEVLSSEVGLEQREVDDEPLKKREPVGTQSADVGMRQKKKKCQCLINIIAKSKINKRVTVP